MASGRSTVASGDVSLTQEQLVLITALGGNVFLTVQVLKTLFKWKAGRVLLLVFLVSALLAAVILVATLEPVRLYVLATWNLFMQALGIHQSKDVDERAEAKARSTLLEDAPDAPESRETAPQVSGVTQPPPVAVHGVQNVRGGTYDGR